MLLEILLTFTLIISVATLAVQLFGLPWKQEKEKKELSQEEPEERERPFTVVFSTDLGASARDCFLALEKKDNETVEFYEGSIRRGVR